MIENIRLSFRGIWSHKLRSLLTMLGIIIGIAAIIAIVSTIQGTNKQIEKNLIGSGSNNVTIQLYQGDYPIDFSYEAVPNGITVINDNTLEEILDIQNVEEASVFMQRQDYSAVYYLNKSLSGGYVMGIGEDYFSVCDLIIKKGRNFSENDISKSVKVCILDEDSSKALFDNEDPIGKTIEIKQEPFRVIGIVGQKESFQPVINSMEDYYTYYQDTSGKVYIPENVWPIINQYDEPQNLVIRVKNTTDMAKLGKQAADILNKNLLVDDDSSVKYKAENLMEQAKEIQQLSSSTNMMLIWIAAISLLVGGIGVMNIMLVSVTERTSEIGLKKAIGAKKSLILGQFLTEAVVLTSIGGVVGVIVGIILAEVISKVNSIPVSISVPASIMAVLFSMVIGIVFGLLPSYKAANLNPIDALRRE